MSDSDFLFADPSFISGMAATLDLGSTLTSYNESPTPLIADALATYSDWRSVGNDLRFAMSKFEESYGEK